MSFCRHPLLWVLGYFLSSLLDFWSGHALGSNFKLELKDSIEYAFEPGDEAISLEEAQKLSYQPLTGAKTSFGYRAKGVWLRFAWHAHNLDGNRYFLVLKNPTLERVDIFIQQMDGSFRSVQSGSKRTPDQRTLSTRLINAELKSVQDQGWVYVRAQTFDFLYIDMSVMDEKSFEQKQLTDIAIYSAYFASLALILVINFILFIWVRSSAQGSYLLVLLFLMLFQSNIEGLIYRLTPEVFHSLHYALYPTLCILSLALFLRFTIVYFGLGRKRRFGRILNNTMLGLFCLALLEIALPRIIATHIIGVAAILTSALIITQIILLAKEHRREYASFVVALVTIGLSLCIFSLSTIGILDLIDLSLRLLMSASIITTLLLTFGLAAHLGNMQSEKKNLELSLKKSQKELHQLDDILTSTRKEQQDIQQELETSKGLLIQADKLSTLGTLVAGVAHDISSPNNLIILGEEELRRRFLNLEKVISELLGEGQSPEELMIRDQFKQDFEGIEAGLTDIQLGARRIKEINQAIRNQARTDRAFLAFSVAQLISECLVILASRINQIEVQVDCSPDLLILGRRSELGQVLMNLVGNAADAIEESKKEAKKIRIIASHVQTDFLLEVEDSGPGIPLELRERILEPFFTTKSLGKGTGIGLSIVRHIITQHRGTITIEESATLGGAKFSVRIPQD